MSSSKKMYSMQSSSMCEESTTINNKTSKSMHQSSFSEEHFSTSSSKQSAIDSGFSSSRKAVKMGSFDNIGFGDSLLQDSDLMMRDTFGRMNKRLDNLSSGLGRSLDTEDLLRKHEIDMKQQSSIKTAQSSKQSQMSAVKQKKTSCLTPDQRSPEIDFERTKKDFGDGIFADLDKEIDNSKQDAKEARLRKNLTDVQNAKDELEMKKKTVLGDPILD